MRDKMREVRGTSASLSKKSLYIALDIDTGVLKIGQSFYPERRVKELSYLYNRSIILLTAFTESAEYESDAHEVLDPHRVKATDNLSWCRGREWFKCTTEEALEGIFKAYKQYNDRASQKVDSKKIFANI